MVKNKECAVKNCFLTDELYKFRSFYKLPAFENTRNKWLEAIPYLSEKSLVCCRHFLRSDYGVHGKRLKLNAVPSKDLEIELPKRKLMDVAPFKNFEFSESDEEIDCKMIKIWYVYIFLFLLFSFS
jgi:hypothetical protein